MLTILRPGEWKLTLKDPCISESCIEIKIELNFFILSGIGTLKVKCPSSKLDQSINDVLKDKTFYLEKANGKI